jgi:hypothetical protein
VLYRGGTIDKRKLESLWEEEMALETKHELMQKTKKVARYPKPQICYICEKQFWPKSLLMHIPTCKKDWKVKQLRKAPQDRKPLP